MCFQINDRRLRDICKQRIPVSDYAATSRKGQKPQIIWCIKKGVREKVKGVPQSQTAALPRHQEEEETDKSKQAQIEQTYEKH